MRLPFFSRRREPDWAALETIGPRTEIRGCIERRGSGALITIGEGAVIGAGSVVTRDVPAWPNAAGNPARVVRELKLDER